MGLDADCVAAFRHVAAIPEIHSELIGGLGPAAFTPGGPLETAFVERCVAAPPEYAACLAAAADNAALYRCPANDALAKAVWSVLPEEKRAAIAREQGHTEVHALLNAIGIGAENSANLPALTPLTPAAACCTYPDGKCPVDPAQWADPAWKAVSFTTTEPLRYQYQLRSEGAGPTRAFAVRAVGDPACDGHPETWEISAHTVEGRLQRDTRDEHRVDSDEE